MEKNKNIDICVRLNHFAVYLKHNIVNQLHFNLKKKKKLLSDQGCIGLDFVNPCPPDHPAVFILAPGRGHRYRSPGHPPPTAPCWDTSSSCVSREKRNVCSVHSKRCPQIPPPNLLLLWFTLASFYLHELVYFSFCACMWLWSGVTFLYALDKKQWEEKIGNCLRINGHWLYQPLSAACSGSGQCRPGE